MAGSPAAQRAFPLCQKRDGRTWTDADQTTRKPLLLFRLFGLFLLRRTAAALLWLLFHEPPRKTNPGHLTPVGWEQNEYSRKWRKLTACVTGPRKPICEKKNRPPTAVMERGGATPPHPPERSCGAAEPSVRTEKIRVQRPEERRAEVAGTDADQTTRKPRLLSRGFGLSLPRRTAAAKLWLLFHEPPRKTRVLLPVS